MTFSLRVLQQVVAAVDRGLRLQDVAERNAAKAVAANRVAALVRADAVAPMRTHELARVGA